MRKTALVLRALLSTLSACSKPSSVRAGDATATYTRQDMGKIQSMDFVRASSGNAYFKVVTDKFVFDELEITQFPGDKVIVGDVIFEQVKLTEDAAHRSACKNDTCREISVCYSWMPCFKKHKPQQSKHTKS